MFCSSGAYHSSRLDRTLAELFSFRTTHCFATEPVTDTNGGIMQSNSLIKEILAKIFFKMIFAKSFNSFYISPRLKKTVLASGACYRFFGNRRIGKGVKFPHGPAT